MRTLDRFDPWFGIVLAPLFAMAAYVVFGMIVTSPSFWSMLPFLGFMMIVGTMRAPLSRLERAPRFFSWFCIGVTAAALGAFGEGQEFSLAIAGSLGLTLVIVDILSERFGRREKRTMADRAPIPTAFSHL